MHTTNPNTWHVEPDASGFRIVSAVPCAGCHQPLTAHELEIGRYCDTCCRRAQDCVSRLRADDGECAGDLIL